MEEQNKIELTNDEFVPLNIQLWEVKKINFDNENLRGRVIKKFNSNTYTKSLYKPISKILILKNA
jgi:hypothetical protein